jgi:hypothetical protein
MHSRASTYNLTKDLHARMILAQALMLIGADHVHTLVAVRVTGVPAEREEGHDRTTRGRRHVPSSDGSKKAGEKSTQ